MPLLIALVTAALAAPSNGGFESPGPGDLPAGWTRGVGAQTGGAARSAELRRVPEARTGDAALRFVGAARDQRWPMAEGEAFDVVPGTSLRFGGWLRTEAVRKERNQYRNCNVGISVLGADGQRLALAGTPPVEGTTPWTERSATVRIPAGGRTARLFVFCSMSGTAWFDDLFVAPVEAPERVVHETPTIVFHAPVDAPISEAHREENQAVLAAFSERLGATLPGPVQFHRYRDNAQKGELTGYPGNAHATPPLEVHTIWPVDQHEVVHLLTATWGPTDSALLGEGIAVAMGGVWHSRPVHTWVPQFRGEGRLPALSMLVDPTGFRQLDDLVTYPVSGSFVAWLVETHGMDRFREAYVGEGGTAARLERVYGMDLAALEAAWLGAVAPN